MRKKIRLFKRAIVEIIETLCTICMYLEYEGRHRQPNIYTQYFHSHFRELKQISKEIRGDNND